MRLLISMVPWMPISRVPSRLSPLQVGQVGQPRPEAVSRTAPPVTTMTTDMARAATVAMRTVAGCGVHRAAMKASGFRAISGSFGTGTW